MEYSSDQTFRQTRSLYQDNILIDDSGNVRITDFGISRVLAVRGFTTTSASFSLRWSSVEILRAVSGYDNHADVDAVHHYHTEASDIWASAITVVQASLYA